MLNSRFVVTGRFGSPYGAELRPLIYVVSDVVMDVVNEGKRCAKRFCRARSVVGVGRSMRRCGSWRKLRWRVVEWLISLGGTTLLGSTFTSGGASCGARGWFCLRRRGFCRWNWPLSFLAATVTTLMRCGSTVLKSDFGMAAPYASRLMYPTVCFTV